MSRSDLIFFYVCKIQKKSATELWYVFDSTDFHIKTEGKLVNKVLRKPNNSIWNKINVTKYF